MRSSIVAAIAVVIGVAAGYLVSRTSAPSAPLLCDIWALPTNAVASDVRASCGEPYTTNLYSSDNHAIEQWVYDARTFLWFRDGVLAFWKAPPWEGSKHLRAVPRFL